MSYDKPICNAKRRALSGPSSGGSTSMMFGISLFIATKVI